MNENLFKAVNLCAWLVREQDVYLGKALNIAANKYKVARADVQREMARRSGKSQAGKKKRIRPVIMCENCHTREACWHLTMSFGFYKVHGYSCAECGKEHDMSRFSGRDEVPDSSKWTRYTPSKGEQGAE